MRAILSSLAAAFLVMGTGACITRGRIPQTLTGEEKAAAQEHEKALLEAAAREDAEALYQLGQVYQYGTFGTLDMDKALVYYQKAIDLGNPEAMVAMGMYKLSGWNGEKIDAMAARRLFSQAAAAGHSGAWNNLGVMAENGIGRPVDMATALEYYECAARNGNPVGAGNAAEFYFYGKEPVEIDYAKARQLFEQAAQSGDVNALQHLGAIYFLGLGTEVDETKARSYLTGWDEEKQNEFFDIMRERFAK